MSDRPPARDAGVSRQMARMPRRDSSLEMRLRRELHALGLRYRTHLRDLPGTPDIALTRAKIAVFCDGCFWHGCPDHGTLPKNNREWWREKLEGNRERDLRKDQALLALGWLPIHVWEHDEARTAAAEIAKLWRLRTGRSVEVLRESGE
jgi:DNA mismatch endonuclease, patch repair protein